MKLSRQKKSLTKPFLITGGVIILAALASGAYWYMHRASIADTTQNTTTAPTNTVNYSPATEQEKSDSAAAKQEAVGNNDQPPTSGSMSVIISRASQVDSAVSVRSVVSGTQTGSCDMTFTMSGKTTVTKNFAIAQGPTAATCNGDIPVSEFPANGNWALSIVAKSSTTSSPPVTQTVSVTK